MTFNTFTQYIDSPTSEKIILAHVHGVKRLFGFSNDDGFFSKATPHFVTGVRQGLSGIELTSVQSLNELVDSNKFFYEVSTSKLYLYSYDNLADEVIVTYRFFYSNIPINLSWNLNDYSPQVEYSPRIQSAPQFKSTMSQGKKGLTLMGSGTLNLINNDRELNKIYASIIWDNKEINIYSYNRNLAPSQSQIMFRGIVSGKGFNSNIVYFNVKDSIYSLDSKIPLSQYGELTREADSLFFKRQIYGKVDNLLVQSINQVGNGYIITGTVSGNYDENLVTGIGTSFMNDISPGDEILLSNFKVTVEDVLSDTLLRTSSLPGSFKDQSISLNPDKHFRNKNRLFQVAGHAVKKWSTTITSIISRNRIVVDSVLGFESGDTISIDNESKTIRRISGNTIVLQTNFNSPHDIGSSVTKTEITNVRYGNKQVEINQSNITIVNNPSVGAQFSISATAEYDAAPQKTINHVFRFINGRNKIWLGSPTFIDITCVANTKIGNGPNDYSLIGKYFTVKDDLGNLVGFWFKDSLEENVTSVIKPSAITTIENTDGAKAKAISLESRPYSDSEIANLVAGAIASNVSAFQFSIVGNVVRLESKDTLDIDVGSSGTSGFTIDKTASGISATNQVNLSKFVTTRDFVKSFEQNSLSFIEVLSVDEKSITLRSNYTGSTKLENLNYKNVEYIQDDTPVYVNCYGKTKNGEASGSFIETAPEAVEDILKQVNLSSRIDFDSFLSASQRSPYLLSMSIPFDFRSKSLPSAKDIINTLNQSTLGSLHITNALNLGYDILDGHIKEDIRQITDNDLVSWTVVDDAFDLSASVISNYRHVDYDPRLDSINNKQYKFTSNFSKNYTQSSNTSENNLYFYKESDSAEVTERDQFINDLSTSIIKIKGSINLSKFTIGERVLINISKLYTAYGSTDNSLRIGVISSISNSGEIVDIEILDLGSLFSRGSRICNNDSPDYTNSTPFQRVNQSFITEDNGILDDNEDTAGTNLIA